MRITYVSDKIFPSRAANSVNIMKMCEAFSSNGHEVVLLAPDHPDEEAGVKNIFDFYGVEESFEVEKLHFPELTGRTYYYGLLASLKAKRDGAEVVYTRFIVAAFFSVLFGLKVIFEAHEPETNFIRPNQFLFRRLAKGKKVDRLIVITEALERYYRKHYPQFDDIHVAPDAADPPDENLRSKDFDDSQDYELTVGYIGHLYKGKSMEVISNLAVRSPGSRFHIVGGTKEDIEYWKEKLDTDNVVFHGFVPHKEIYKYSKGCDVLLAPYQKKVTGHGDGKSNLVDWMSPLKIFEYMAVGKPIVASDLPVLREVLEDQVNALLVSPDKVGEWEAALKDLRENPDLRSRLGGNARADFEESFTWEARAENVLQGISD